MSLQCDVASVSVTSENILVLFARSKKRGEKAAVAGKRLLVAARPTSDNHQTDVTCGKDGPYWWPRRPAGTSSACVGDTFDVCTAGGVPLV